jgi:hypothetical protein
MKPIISVCVVVAALIATGLVQDPGGVVNTVAAQALQKTSREVPKFEVDPTWPKLPAKWVFGQVSSVSVDENGHAWVLQRPNTVRADQKGRAAPPVLEFDENGNYVQGWGGPGEGYDWPEIEHGIYVDPKGFVWLGGNGKTDNHLVKFTKAGKFVMQIGHKSQSKGNLDTQNVKEAADTFVYAKNQRVVRRRRLRQQPYHRVRCRYRRVQAHVGRVRQGTGVTSAAAESRRIIAHTR